MTASNPHKELTSDNNRFSFAVQPSIAQNTAGGKKTRTFAGVAYSGEVIQNHWYWGNVIFDLHSMSVPAKLPALIDHDRGQRCGYVTASSTTDTTGFTVEGVLLSNEHGASVAADSDEGFPWQMSVHINPGSTEEVSAGTGVNVNGRIIPGPVVVFRNSTLAEVSFTAAGWDANTSAAAMSRGGNKPPSKGDDSMDLTQATARVATLEAENATLKAGKTAAETSLATANDALKQFGIDARTAAVKQLFSDLGREYKADADDVKKFSQLPKEAFDLTASMLREQHKPSAVTTPATLPAVLFSHQAGQTAPSAATPPTNPLLADAQARASQFSKR